MLDKSDVNSLSDICIAIQQKQKPATVSQQQLTRLSAALDAFDASTTPEEASETQDIESFGGLQVDAYGLGVHMNQYGQPVTVKPDFGGVPGEQLQIKENAYGPGIHMDQYGRPVREHSWP